MIATLLLHALLTSSAAPVELLLPGKWHGNEVTARDGEAWLALRVHGTDAALLPTRLRIASWHDELLDDPGKASGRQVDSDVDGTTLFVRGGGLRAGPVASLAIAGERDVGADETLRLGGREYRIGTHCGPSPSSAMDPPACEIRLEHGGTRQILARMSGHAGSPSGSVQPGDDAEPHLIFAGDIDRDGRLDLVFDVTDHYNVSRPTLFLSSQAAGGELVRQVAQFESVGC